MFYEKWTSCKLLVLPGLHDVHFVRGDSQELFTLLSHPLFE